MESGEGRSGQAFGDGGQASELGAAEAPGERAGDCEERQSRGKAGSGGSGAVRCDGELALSGGSMAAGEQVEARGEDFREADWDSAGVASSTHSLKDLWAAVGASFLTSPWGS